MPFVVLLSSFPSFKLHYLNLTYLSLRIVTERDAVVSKFYQFYFHKKF